MNRFLFLALFAFSIFQGICAAEEQAPAGFRGELLIEIDDVGKKLVDLADAIPEEKYAWRPADGVRSVSEVFMHVAAGNYRVLKFAAVEPPADLPKDMEKTITKKTEVIARLKKGIDHLRQALLKASDADLEKPADFFGQKTTVRGIFLRMTEHMHEHLGQAIAYGRINGVVPPWSRNQPQ